MKNRKETADLLVGLSFLFLLCVLAMLAEHPPR